MRATRLLPKIQAQLLLHQRRLAPSADTVASSRRSIGEAGMPFGLRLGASPVPVGVYPVSVEIHGAGFSDVVLLPVAGTVTSHNYHSNSAKFDLTVKFSVANTAIYVIIHRVGGADVLSVLAEPNDVPGQPPGVRFMGTVWHASPQTKDDPDHCTITCEASGETADCCIICTNGSSTTKICC